MDDFRIDSHKLIYHIPRVNQWLMGEDISPIYLEISPSGTCNHRCLFCAFDYLGYKSRFIDTKSLKDFLTQAAGCGIKSVMYSGEGEPLLHKDITELIVYTRKLGIDVAITTNGVFLNEKIARECLDSLSWVKISLNAATSDTYAKVHGCRYEDFDLVLKNIDTAVELKRKNNYPSIIGVQMVLLPDNASEVTVLASLLKAKGVDYLIIKPFSRHPLSRCSIKGNFDYNNYLYLADELKQYSTDEFRIIFRFQAMNKLKEKRAYQGCPGISFFAYIASNGDIFPCQSFVSKGELSYGNIHRESFSEIWKGPTKGKVFNFLTTDLDVRQCRAACRLDEINRYLWELKHPSAHVNFI
jgi:cyclic pyranopterin phosphate synthase